MSGIIVPLSSSSLSSASAFYWRHSSLQGAVVDNLPCHQDLKMKVYEYEVLARAHGQKKLTEGLSLYISILDIVFSISERFESIPLVLPEKI